MFCDALQAAYEMARQDSDVPDADLHIEEVPVVIFCATCGCERTLAPFVDLFCPSCATLSSSIIQGRDMELVALEIET